MPGVAVNCSGMQQGGGCVVKGMGVQRSRIFFDGTGSPEIFLGCNKTKSSEQSP